MTEITVDRNKGSTRIKWGSVTLITCAMVAIAAVLLFVSSLGTNTTAVVRAPASPIPQQPVIPVKDYSAEELSAIRDGFWSLKGDKARCARKFVENRQRANYARCVATGAGDNVGGGCAHLSGGAFLSAPLLEAAMVHCNASR